MRVGGLTGNQILMAVDNSTGKCASCMDRYGSVVDRMYMKLGS